jgi:Protein of unknown function (DUF3467)
LYYWKSITGEVDDGKRTAAGNQGRFPIVPARGRVLKQHGGNPHQRRICHGLHDGRAAGTVTSRVIVSPGHIKRMITALQDNVKKYEARFGTIQAAEETKAKLGFQA